MINNDVDLPGLQEGRLGLQVGKGLWRRRAGLEEPRPPLQGLRSLPSLSLGEPGCVKSNSRQGERVLGDGDL